MHHGSAGFLLKPSTLAALILMGASAAASAAECPADQRKEDVRQAPTDQVWDGAKLQSGNGINDRITAAIDVSKPPVNIPDRTFRLRKLTVLPGGVVPWHRHADRPAIAYLLEGEITEYASNCAVPVVHKPGDVIVETPNLSHWWKNFGSKNAVVISGDLLKGDDDNM
ncbi:MAG: cupin domain-containing protein [Alphaproteobacteria bacterium]|nr:cupin domain-containing protein [Alphaproteobacteria bacterium]